MSRIGEQLLPADAFDGRTYQPEFDHARLSGQLAKVYAIMQHGHWHDLYTLATLVGGSEAACSARLRDLRKPKYGSHVIDRRRVGTSGLFQYRLVK